jgi:AraC-like DNA-binding protein
MTSLARIPLLLLRGAEQLYGLDRQELLETAGLSERELADPDARVSLSKIWSLWRVLIDRTGDPALGLHLGSRVVVRDMGLVGYAVYHSATLREAFERMSRYSRIVNEALVIRLLDDEDSGRVVVDKAARLDELVHPLVSRLASLVTVAREITGVPLSPIAVRFRKTRPADVSEFQGFFRGRLEFDADEASLVFGREDLDRPVVAADETLSGYLDRLADEVLESIDSSVTFKQRVRRAIWFDLSGGKPSLRSVAKQLGVSPRTLQRRMEEDGTSFAVELDALRHEMAMRLLQDHTLAVYEVAFLLGYSEPSTFYRAFRRWKRLSPQEYRRTVS